MTARRKVPAPVQPTGRNLGKYGKQFARKGELRPLAKFPGNPVYSQQEPLSERHEVREAKRGGG